MNMKRKKAKKVRIYKTKPSAKIGWQPMDPARNASQAKSFVKAGYQGADAIAVKTGPAKGKGRHVFPYTIYTRQKDWWKRI